ncbi:MAG TPA: ATP-binding protein [Nitrospiria bacterium]|nr:ATP-binding protein [Nitrospiria bacterium]
MAVRPPLGRHRLVRRLVLPYALLIIGTLAVSGWFFYGAAQDALDQELTKRLLTVAQTVRSVITPRYLTQLRPSSEGTTLYALLLADLKRVQQASKASHIYVLDPQHRMLLDGDERTPIGREFLSVKLDAADLADVWKGRSAASILYRGQDGKFYKSGYAPLVDQDGTVVAIVGVEAGADFFEALTVTRRQVALTVAVSLLILLSIGWWLSRSILKPLDVLVSAMDRVGKGEPPAKVNVLNQDEIGYLGRRFNEMVDALAEKDRLLTELYQQERQRADRHRGYSDFLLRSMTTGVIGVDFAGRLTSINPAALDILDLSTEDMGEELDSLLERDHSIMILLESTLAGQAVQTRQELRLQTRAGRQKWVGVHTAPLHDHDGILIGASALLTDLTAVRKLQDEIRRKDRLAAIGQLSAGIAHEIRNPLAAIEGFSELLARRVPDEGARVLLDEIVQEVRHLNRIVSDFLTFAREPQLHFESTDVGTLLEGTLSLLLSTHPKPITLTGNLPQHLPPVVLDPNEFRRALLNILRNALEAMPSGGTLSVTAELSDDWLTVTIRDSGPGIPEHVKDQIFTPFFTTKDEGTGLGLAIAHKIVEGHRGVIEVDSAPGTGSAFTIRIPLERTPHEAYPHR